MSVTNPKHKKVQQPTKDACEMEFPSGASHECEERKHVSSWTLCRARRFQNEGVHGHATVAQSHGELCVNSNVKVVLVNDGVCPQIGSGRRFRN